MGCPTKKYYTRPLISLRMVQYLNLDGIIYEPQKKGTLYVDEFVSPKNKKNQDVIVNC